MKACFIIDPITKNIENIADKNEFRACAPWTVFEGKIVVSGGLDVFLSGVRWKSVSVYDHCGNKSKQMPDMVWIRCYYLSVSIINKLWIVGGSSDNWELFDININHRYFDIRWSSSFIVFNRITVLLFLLNCIDWYGDRKQLSNSYYIPNTNLTIDCDK